MKGNTCPYCGAPSKTTSTSYVCEFCGYSLKPNKNNQDKLAKSKNNSNINASSSDPSNLQDISFKLIKSKYNYESNFKIIALTIITCGLYYIYKLLNWAEILNEADVGNNSKIDKGSIILFSIITCGLATVYYHYKIAKKSIDFANKTRDYNNTIREGIKKPIKDLPGLILLSWIISWSISIFSEGEGYWITIPIMLWTIISVQRSVEYSAGIKKDI